MTFKAISRARPPSPVRPLTAKESADLDRYFGPARTVYGGSTFGAQIERAAIANKLSDGKTVDIRRHLVVKREIVGPKGETKTVRVLSGWPYLYVKKEAPPEGRMPEDRDQDMRLLARFDARMKLLEGRRQTVLSLLYGDQGCRWSRELLGRCWALVPFLPAAQRALARWREQEGHPEDWEDPLLPAERLALLAREKPRPPWADAARDLAEQLQRETEAAWVLTAPGEA